MYAVVVVGAARNGAGLVTGTVCNLCMMGVQGGQGVEVQPSNKTRRTYKGTGSHLERLVIKTCLLGGRAAGDW
jgi:hypothetical protein